MDFKSLPQLLDYFKSEEVGIEYYEKIRWNGNVICPHCGKDKPYKTNRGYKCSSNTCYKKFTVKTNTIFESSKIPFRIWFAAIYLCTGHKKGISSVQLALDLNITQKTAWFVLHRIREMLKNQAPELVGGENTMVESDETYIGGKEKNKHFNKKNKPDENGIIRDTKKVVVGLVERNGKVVLKHIERATNENMVDFVKEKLAKGSIIYTDEHKAYKSLKKVYTHNTVNHSLKVYVTGNVHTNTIENFWSVLKRGLCGIYHQVSDKHLDRYLNEFAARYNARHNSPYDNFKTFLENSEGGLLYKDLIAD